MQLAHTMIRIKSIEESLDFYCNFCGLEVVHERGTDGGGVVWLGHPDTSDQFIFVLIQSDVRRPPQNERDYSHLGFALESRAGVDAIAARAAEAGCLVWAPRDEAYPVGYYCGLKDPDGHFVEFSFGQPLGPGAPSTA